jgi:hypothetical protein
MQWIRTIIKHSVNLGTLNSRWGTIHNSNSEGVVFICISHAISPMWIVLLCNANCLLMLQHLVCNTSIFILRVICKFLFWNSSWGMIHNNNGEGGCYFMHVSCHLVNLKFISNSAQLCCPDEFYHDPKEVKCNDGVKKGTIKRAGNWSIWVPCHYLVIVGQVYVICSSCFVHLAIACRQSMNTVILWVQLLWLLSCVCKLQFEAN